MKVKSYSRSEKNAIDFRNYRKKTIKQERKIESECLKI